MSIQNLLESRAALDAQINSARETHRAEGISKIQALMDEHGLSIADFREPKQRKPIAKVAMKYRNPADGSEWSGRGIMPRWMRTAIDSGGKRDDFLI